MKDARFKSKTSTSRKGNEVTFDLMVANNFEAEKVAFVRAVIENNGDISIRINPTTKAGMASIIEGLRLQNEKMYLEVIRPDVDAEIQTYLENQRDSRYED